MEVRRSEEREGDGGWEGDLGLRLREQEGKKKKRERERQKRYIERKKRSMYSQWPQQPQDVAPVHLYSLLYVTPTKP